MARLMGKDLVILRQGFNALFVKAFNNAEDPADVMPFITETTSTGSKEDYGWLGNAPSMSEWIDERTVKALNEFDYEIVNKDYEGTLSVSKNAIEDDQLGNVDIRINDLGRKAKIHPRKLFIEALVAGEVELCYDGQPLFSASHEEGNSGVQSNIVTGTGVTLALLSDDIETAEARLLSFKDDTGEPVNEGEIKIGIICPESLKAKFQNLNTLDMLDNSSNRVKGRIAHLAYSSRLTDKNDWYMSNIAEGVKAVIKQKRQDPKFTSLQDESESGFMKKIFHYGVDYRVGFGYGLWQKIVKVKNT